MGELMSRLQISRALPFLLVALASSAAAQDQPQYYEWRSVATLEPGQTITVTTRAGASAERDYVSSDDAVVTLLNPNAPGVPDEAARELRHVARTHPDYLDGARAGRGFGWNSIRVSQDGVFVGTRKVAELQQVLETRSKSEVKEVTRLRRGRGFWGHLGPIGGYFVGAMGTVAVESLVCRAVRCDDGAAMVGMLVGGVAGGAYGAYAAHRETEEIVYVGSRE